MADDDYMEMDADMDSSGPRRTSGRTTTLTEKGRLYQIENKQREYKNVVSRMKYQIRSARDLIDKSDLSGLRPLKTVLSNLLRELKETYENLRNFLSASDAVDLDVGYLNLEGDAYRMFEEVKGILTALDQETGYDKKSLYSRGSGRSKGSSKSSRDWKFAAAKEAAEAETQLKFLSLEARKSEELEKVKITKKLEMARATLTALEAVDQEELEDQIREDFAPDGKKAHIERYLHSQQVDVRPKMELRPEAENFVPLDQHRSPEQAPRRQQHGVQASMYSDHLGIPEQASRMQQHHDEQYVDRDPFHSNQPRSTLWRARSEAGSGDSLMGAAAVVRHLNKPPVEISKFDGNILSYRRFMRQFEARVVTNTINDDERLTYLEQLTTGEPNKIVKSYSQLPSAAVAYQAILSEFEDRYGDTEVIANAYVRKVLDWPIVKANDTQSLDQFAIYMTECLHAAQSLDSMRILEYPDICTTGGGPWHRDAEMKARLPTSAGWWTSLDRR